MWMSVDIVEEASVPRKVPVVGAARDGLAAAATAICCSATANPDGEVVFLEGDAGDRLYLLLSGTMHVYVEWHSPICCIRETLSFSCTIDFSWIPELGDQSQPWL